MHVTTWLGGAWGVPHEWIIAGLCLQLPHQRPVSCTAMHWGIADNTAQYHRLLPSQCLPYPASPERWPGCAREECACCATILQLDFTHDFNTSSITTGAMQVRRKSPPATAARTGVSRIKSISGSRKDCLTTPKLPEMPNYHKQLQHNARPSQPSPFLIYLATCTAVTADPQYHTNVATEA